MTTLAALTRRIARCTICVDHLPHGPRPVVQVHEKSRILIAGQAPGRRVHESGVPFDDPSGDRLREWLGVDRQTFYDPAQFAILPMGFCYPGTGKSGDHPPRPECAEKWRADVLARLGSVRLTLVIGQYAQAYHLATHERRSVTDTVKAWRDHGPGLLPLPHPSPRNQSWMTRNPWFEREVLPELRRRVRASLASRA